MMFVCMGVLNDRVTQTQVRSNCYAVTQRLERRKEASQGLVKTRYGNV